MTADFAVAFGQRQGWCFARQECSIPHLQGRLTGLIADMQPLGFILCVRQSNIPFARVHVPALDAIAYATFITVLARGTGQQTPGNE